MTVMDLNLLIVKDEIEQMFKGKISKQSVGFSRRKVENWASLTYNVHDYMGWPNNDDVGKPDSERVKVPMTTNTLDYRDVLDFSFKIQQSHRILDKFPKGGIIRIDLESDHIGLESFNNDMHDTYWYVRNQSEFNNSIEYLMSIVEANYKYMEFMFPHLEETMRLGGKIPKRWKRDSLLSKLGL